MYLGLGCSITAHALEAFGMQNYRARARQDGKESLNKPPVQVVQLNVPRRIGSRLQHLARLISRMRGLHLHASQGDISLTVS